MGYEDTLNLLHSFYNFNYVLKLPIKNITRLLNKAIEKDREKTAWDLWSNMYPYMIIGRIKAQSFNDFKNDLFQQTQQYSSKSIEEIEEEMNEVIAAYEKAGDKLDGNI